MEWCLEVTLAEAKRWLIGVKTTAPGADGVNVTLLTAWGVIGERVRALYEWRLRLGHYLHVFKTALVTMIPKPGRADLTTVKPWRPISLLPCLGKGLERLFNRRLSVEVVREGLLNNQLFGGLPKRAATDLVASVLYDVERWLLADARCKAEALFLTMDILGAFNAVFKYRLVKRMRELGFPLLVVKFVESFVTDRKGAVRFGRTVGPCLELSRGLPQGYAPLTALLRSVLRTSPTGL